MSNCSYIELSNEIIDYVKGFESDELLLRGGGIPIDFLDRAAFGFSKNDIDIISPDKLKIRWLEDINNVKQEVEKSGLTDVEWSNGIDLSEPIDVEYWKDDENGFIEGFYISDGHHRYYAAKTLGRPLKINLEIRINSIERLAPGLGYDNFHRCAFRQVNEGVVKEAIKNIIMESRLNSPIKHLEMKMKSSGRFPKIPVAEVFYHENLGDSTNSKYMFNLFSEPYRYIDENRFEEMPVRLVDVKKIVPTQRFLTFDNLDKIYEGKDTDAFLAKKDNLYYILDGHHRIAYNIIEGNKNIAAYVFDLDTVQVNESIRAFVSKVIRESLANENSYKEVGEEDFMDALLDLTTLDLEDSQVSYPKEEGLDLHHLFGGNDYDLYLINRDSLPSSGPFECFISNNDDENIGFIRGIKSGNIISINLIHIDNESRGNGIGTDIYEKILDEGYLIRSDHEITDSTYSLYSNLMYSGYRPLLFSDMRVGLAK